MTFDEYKKDFWARQPLVTFEPGTRHVGPTLLPPARGVPRWRLDWIILFPDNNYVRIADQWDPVKGSRTEGIRAYFSFHYGETPAVSDSRGIPKKHHTEPRVIRIDMKNRNDVHIHYADKDHVPEAQVHGLKIRDINVLDFINAVVAHRKDHRTLAEILGFNF